MSGAGKIGVEFLVNSTTAGSQYDPAVTALANGGFVVTWQDEGLTGDDTSGAAIRAQIYAADGTRSGSEFLVNTTTSQSQIRPTVTGLTDGRFVVAWEDGSGSTGDGSGQAIRGRIFNGDGTESVAEFLIPVTVDASQREPAIAALPSGGFVVVWTDFSGFQDIHPSSVRAQVFDAQGQRVGAEFRVNTTLPNPQWQPTIAAFPDGHFVVAWTDLSGAGGDPSPAIRAQVFEHNGALRGGEILVNTTTFNAQQYPSIAASADGHFAIVWQDTSQDAGNIRAQVFNPDGSPSGNEFVVNSSTGLLQSDPTVTALPDGRFVAAWRDGSASVGDVSGAAIRAQVFNADGTLSGGEFLVNTTTASAQERPTVTTLPDGRFVIAWQDISQSGGDTNGYAVRAQMFIVGEPPVINSNGGGDAAAVSIAENTTAVTTVTATDADSALVTYAIAGGADADKFAIDPLSGALSFVTAPNFEAPADADHNNTYQVVVRASDGAFNDTQAITVTVANENEAPVIDGGDDLSVSRDENTTNVATIHATDADGADIIYSISGGADALLFQIDSASGVLSFRSAPDFEAPADADHDNNYVVLVRASDGLLYDEQAITVGVENANEQPFFKGGGGDVEVQVPENETGVDQVKGFDPDGDNLTYSISGGADGDLFQIDAVTGDIAFIVPPDFEAPADANDDNRYDVRVRISDGSLFAERNVTVVVTDVVETPAPNALPTIESNGGGDSAAVSVSESTTAVTTVAATDQDDDPLTYSIVGGADAAHFQIDASTGALSFVDAPDFEMAADADNNNSYVVTVRASDGTLFDEQTITVNVTNVGGVSIVGDANDNRLVGTLENDTIYGRAANDRLVGSGGGDMLNGEAGTDTADYIFNDAGVTVDLAAGTGADGVIDTLVSIENVIGSDRYADTIRGDGGANKLEGATGDDVIEGRAGNDRLEGGAGNDLLIGSAGDDELIGQTGIDTVDYSGSLGGTGVVVDLRTEKASGGAGNDRVSDVENVWGSNFNDTLHGNNEQNQLQGRAGNDALYGNGGDDPLDGGDGDDTIVGGTGSDSLYGGAGNDRFVWNAGDGADDVVGGAGNDTIDYNGSAANESYEIAASLGTVRIVSSSGGPNVSIFVSGVEIVDLDTGGGDDQVHIDTFAGTGVTGVTVTLGAGNDKFTAGLLDTAVIASGQDGDDELSGSNGNDNLKGDTGNDLLTGGAGNDKLDGGAGNDVLVGGPGADALIGGAGTDRVYYSGEAAVTVDLVAGTATNGSVDTLSGLEEVVGSLFNDTLRGDSGANQLVGSDGDDLVEGRGGNDLLEGGAGNDRLNGGDGNDEVYGRTGNDLLDGAAGDDLVRGNEGNDSVEGRDGNDELRGDAGDDTIDAGAGNDLLFGGDGNDRLFAAGGVDTLTGGAGNDLFYYTNPAPGQMNGDTITDFQSVAGQNTGDSLMIRSGYSGIAFNNGSTAITYDGVTQTLYHPGVTLSLANDILVV